MFWSKKEKEMPVNESVNDWDLAAIAKAAAVTADSRAWGGQWSSQHVVRTTKANTSGQFDLNIPTHYSGTMQSVHPECLEKHVVGEIVQYPDGVFGNCANCGDRVKIPTVPGGYTAIQVRGFLERVIAGDESEHDGDLLVELGKLLAVLDLEEQELLLAKNRVQIAETLLKQRAAA